MTPATSPRARTAAAYMTIENRGTAPDRLIAVATPPPEGRAPRHRARRRRDAHARAAAHRDRPGAKAVLQPGACTS
jgi:hypothetical protein